MTLLPLKSLHEDEDPWNYFIKPSTSNTEKLIQQSWPQYWNQKLNKTVSVDDCSRLWLFQLAQYGFKRLEFLSEDLNTVQIDFNYSLFIFSLKIKKFDGFPYVSPKWECHFQANFHYNWLYRYPIKTYKNFSNQKQSSISELINKYREYIENMNDILEEIQSINSMEFKILEEDLTKLEFDEENSKFLIVHLVFQPTLTNDKPLNWSLVLYLDTNDILSYPHKIMTEPLRVDILQKIDPIKWIGDRRLYDNLLNLFESYFN